MIKLLILKFVWAVAYVREKTHAYKVLKQKPEGKISSERPRYRLGGYKNRPLK
jgi:hypothetical protein